MAANTQPGHTNNPKHGKEIGGQNQKGAGGVGGGGTKVAK